MSPELGRFVSRDPIAGDAFEARSLARYPYAFSDPVNKLDPTGGFTLYEVGLSQSVRSLLGTSVVASFVVGTVIDFALIAKDLAGVPSLPLNQTGFFGELGNFGPGEPTRVGGVSVPGGVGVGGGKSPEAKLTFELGVKLGGGAVEKAYKLSGSLAGTSDVYSEALGGAKLTHKLASSYELINELYAWHASQWMLELPATAGSRINEDNEIEGFRVPAGYFACGFNNYVAANYTLKFMKSLIGPGSKHVDLAAPIVGAWLAYTNLVVLEGETALHMALPNADSLQTEGGCGGRAR
jgi:hypothetical protein